MKENENHLPVYGVGPYYGVSILLLTAIGIFLSATDILKSGKISGFIPVSVMVLLGILLIAEGFFI